jgi:hypothetical protein
MRSIEEVLHTDGNGFWSNESRPVSLDGMELHHKPHARYGELRVFFKKETWNTSVHGLIYTDPLFLTELKEYLNRAGYATTRLTYSEQGMQGDNYVSCDVDNQFIESWHK